ncbi:biopolymer transporter ExbD [Brevundimonas sp.]|uniref:biopolymer transporter ExbD n=1 Tax=Brevundimonas sp. TaxID=1871086 RepID=UPI002D68EECD|nr:biopolymer transporter ExbD [Brevundimonas sp.]HYC66763.1 biopolymer transporter ExbD [Brevundimonas sp.]
MAAKLSGPGGGKAHTIEQNADINVTPFVDIMLVLLIIFMVAAPMATVSIRLDLPPAVPPPPDAPQKDPVYITVQETGSIFIADVQTSLEGLSADVCTALGGGDPACRQERVFIRADPEVTYNQFMEVMNELQRKGFFKVGLLNEDIE